MRSNFGAGIVAIIALTGGGTGLAAQQAEHAHHQLSEAQFAELRTKIPLYRELSDAEILANMARMGPNFHEYLSPASVRGELGVLALGHGYEASGNEVFRDAFRATAANYPTAIGLGMAMMTSQHLQAAVDALVAAGARKILVLPITTLKTGGLIKQWRYIFSMRDEAPWMSVPRIQADAEFVFGPTPTTDPVISRILLAHAQAISEAPEQEAVALLSHGPDNAELNRAELEILASHAAFIRREGGFATVRGFTLQDDAPRAIRRANINRIREWTQLARDRGQRVLVLTTLPVRGSVHRKIRRDLEGLEYTLSEQGVMQHPLFSEWVASVIEQTAAGD